MRDEQGPCMASKERLIDRLKEIRLLKNRASELALRSVPRSEFLPPGFEALGDCDVPVPCRADDRERFVPSPKFMALLLEALDLTENQRIAVVDSRGGYVAAAVATAMGGRGSVTAVELDLKEEETVLHNLERARVSSGVEVMGIHAFLAKPSTYTRVLLLTRDLLPKDLVKQVADMGFILGRGGPEGLALVRAVRSGDQLLEIMFGDVRLIGPLAGPRGQEAFSDVDVSRVLGMEDIISHVWTGKFLTEKEASVSELVKETVAGGALDVSGQNERDGRRLSALKAFHMAYMFQSMGYAEEAEDLYKASIALFPTAEAYTFLGWRLSFDGRYAEAIDQCKHAIDMDPAFGNPYNDIGAYLIEMGRLDEAIGWLERALRAKRYCCPCYAHCNLGRVYMMKGKSELARREFEIALQINPRYDLAKELNDRVCGELDYFA